MILATDGLITQSETVWGLIYGHQQQILCTQQLCDAFDQAV